MLRLLVAALAVALVAGCSGDEPGSRTVALPTSSPTAAPTGDVPQERLSAMLLQADDLPGLPSRRPFASAALSTQATPQLALCQPTAPDAPHQIANVLAQSSATPPLKVFQVLSVYADEAAATAAYDRAVAAAGACGSYTARGTAYTVSDLGPVDVGAPAALHYRLTTPDVVSGDVRTLARSGRFLVLVSGFGDPPGEQDLLAYQADVMRRALARLG